MSVRNDPTDDSPGWWRWCWKHRMPRNGCVASHAGDKIMAGSPPAGVTVIPPEEDS